METITSLVDWSRAMFALTAIYHWCFVPLTLGLSFIIAFMETKYVITGDEFWKRTTKFWMRLFGVNFAIGVATGIILEFEFGTNWSNYSYFVGDIFGAPLAIEGIFAFFMESTFIAIMFFGWNRVSKKFHLTATWLTAVGANLSALWILVANAWMQSPVGMEFNPETARNEMVSFWEVLFSPVAINKFFHTVTSAFVLASVFVVGVSSWFLLKKRETQMALKSIKIASVFGLISAICVAWTGDGSAYQVARVQPMKLAAMEGLHFGKTNAPLTILPGIEVPSLLSVMAYRDKNAFVAGVDDLVYGNFDQNIMPTSVKMERGKAAIELFAKYRQAKEERDTLATAQIADIFKNDKFFKDNYFAYFGYGYLEKPEDAVPPVNITFWSFRIMVGLGLWFIVMFLVTLVMLKKKVLENKRWWLRISLWSIALAYLASHAGWIVAEVGRQPWTIQNLLPTNAAVSRVSSAAVQTTFWVFAVLFTVLLVAEIMIMVKQIKRGGE
ncbi:Cytochrome d ubiquinol oxidase subunit I [Mucinivorans hirudinis]|uniref:Cytochrome d ubiquinol oxidase subunit I n=1 Tax=Mucinivorans hirudinis TaxID=1433126 RepID=A0A060RBX0_9BACT|nr:Cytochrome d ubiquinol oxidase subunit I [Mucinivorans hirudinis]